MRHELPSRIVPQQMNTDEFKGHFPNIIDPTIFTPDYLGTINEDTIIQAFTSQQPKAYVVNPSTSEPVEIRLPNTGMRNGAYIAFFDVSNNGDNKPDRIIAGSEENPIVYTMIKNQRLEFIWMERTREWVTNTTDSDIHIYRNNSVKDYIYYDLLEKIRGIHHIDLFGTNINGFYAPLGNFVGDFHVQVGNYISNKVDFSHRLNEIITRFGPVSSIDEMSIGGKIYFTNRFGPGSPQNDEKFSSIGPLTDNQNIVHDGIPGYVMNDNEGSQCGAAYRDKIVNDQYIIRNADASARFALAQGCTQILKAKDPFNYWNILEIVIDASFADSDITLNIDKYKWVNLHHWMDKMFTIQNNTDRDVTVTFKAGETDSEKLTVTVNGSSSIHLTGNMTLDGFGPINTSETAFDEFTNGKSTQITVSESEVILDDLIEFSNCTVFVPKGTSLSVKDEFEDVSGYGNTRFKLTAEEFEEINIDKTIDDSVKDTDIYNRNLNVFILIENDKVRYFTSLYNNPIINGTTIWAAVMVGGFYYGEMMAHNDKYVPVKNLGTMEETDDKSEFIYVTGILENSVYDFVRHCTAKYKNTKSQYNVNDGKVNSALYNLVDIEGNWYNINPVRGCAVRIADGFYPLKDIDIDNESGTPLTDLTWYNMVQLAAYYNMRLPTVNEAMLITRYTDFTRDNPISVYGIRSPNNMAMATDDISRIRGENFERADIFPELMGDINSQVGDPTIHVFTANAKPADTNSGFKDKTFSSEKTVGLTLDESKYTEPYGVKTYLRLCCSSTI